MGSCLRTEDRLHFTSRKVNGDSRNPDVLPTFLRVIPRWHRRHPQLFPMVRSSGTRRATTVGAIAASLTALTLGAIGVLGLGDRSAEAGVSPVLYLSTGALGAAAGDAALGFRTGYYEPPALSDPALPGFTINSGADQPDPFMYQDGGRYYLFTSQDGVPTNVPVRSGTVVGRWDTPTDALPDPPGVGDAGEDVGPRRGAVRQPLHAVLHLTAGGRHPADDVHRRRNQHRRRPAPTSPRRPPSSARSPSAAPSTPGSSSTPTASPTWSGSRTRTHGLPTSTRRSTASPSVPTACIWWGSRP